MRLAGRLTHCRLARFHWRRRSSRQAFERFVVDEPTLELARRFQTQGLRGVDALHLATAVAAKCDILLTTDDRFVKRARDLRAGTGPLVENPARWVVENAEDGT